MNRIPHPAMFSMMALLLVEASSAGEKMVTLHLNWIPGPEHAPLYYAQKSGLYARAGVAVTIEPGAGSGRTVGAVAKDPTSMGVADLQTVLVQRSKGMDVVAVMNLFANSPYTFYWLKSRGIRSIRDFASKRIGTEERDPARVLWRALAKINGVDPSAVTWVDVPNSGKVDALRKGTIDIAVNAFPDSSQIYPQAFGNDLGELRWRDAGLNLYNISLIASTSLVQTNPHLVGAVVRATQQAVATCLTDGRPCIDALIAAYPNLRRAEELANWRWTAGLYQHTGQRSLPLGAFDLSRVRKDFAIERELQSLDARFDPTSAIDNQFLDVKVRDRRQSSRLPAESPEDIGDTTDMLDGPHDWDPNAIGTFVYHCHVLEHEDGGMMGTIRVERASALE